MKISNSLVGFSANKMSKMQAQYLNRELRKAKNVDIICHDMTDRDGANSALAMSQYLDSLGIHSRVILSQKNPQLLNLRTYDFNFVQASDKNEIDKVIPDVAFCVDFGSEKRVSPLVLEHIKKAGKIMGLDHHSEVDIASDGYIQFDREIVDSENITSSALFYSDKSAKSATSVIYRYFEALGYKIDSNLAYDLFLGLADDMKKTGMIEYDGKKGVIIPKEELLKHKNVSEVFFNLRNKLSNEQVAKIAKSIDVMANLTPEQEEFAKSLNDKLQYSKNGKIAYVELSPDDEQWRKLGGDNNITSAILNNFRRKTLKNDKNLEVVMAFYEANGNYRFSAHAKKPVLYDFFKYIEKNAIKDFTKNAGGHPDRAGGSIGSLDNFECHKWVNNIISCDDFFQK